MIRNSHNRAVLVTVPEHTQISVNLLDISGEHKQTARERLANLDKLS